jgi:hypothetical protein
LRGALLQTLLRFSENIVSEISLCSDSDSERQRETKRQTESMYEREKGTVEVELYVSNLNGVD